MPASREDSPLSSADYDILVAGGGMVGAALALSLIHISEPTRQLASSRMPSSA